MIRNDLRRLASWMSLLPLTAALILPTVPGASAGRAGRTVSLGAGTVIPVNLDEALSSDQAKAGDSFTATVNDKSGAFPSGAKVQGVVRTATPQQGKNPGVLDLAFRRVQLPDGHSYPISGSVIGLDNKSVTRSKDGRLIAKPAHRNDRLTYLGYGAGAGLLVGALTHKRLLEDTLIGAGVGYLAGSLIKGHSSAKNVSLKSGTEIGVRLNNKLNYALAR